MNDALAMWLNALNAETLAALLVQGAEADENFRLRLEAKLAAQEAHEQRTPLDPEPFRRQAEALLEPARAIRPWRHWDDSHLDIEKPRSKL